MSWKPLYLAPEHLCLCCPPLNFFELLPLPFPSFPSFLFFLSMGFSSNIISSKQTSLGRIGQWVLCARPTFFQACNIRHVSACYVANTVSTQWPQIGVNTMYSYSERIHNIVPTIYASDSPSRKAYKLQMVNTMFF